MRRVAINHTFHRWKRFHLLHSEVKMKPQKGCILIGACAVLHNIPMLENETKFLNDIESDDQPDVLRYNGPNEIIFVTIFLSLFLSVLSTIK